MSKMNGNSVVKGARGTFGDDMVFKKVRKKTLMVKPPGPREPGTSTSKQKAHIKRFQKAVRYATRMLANEATKAEYEAGIKGKKFTARLVAISDFFNAPEIESINADTYVGVIGDKVFIEATDDFKVVSVKVLITGADGITLEQGAAESDPEDSDRWIYTATAANGAVAGTKITVTATDKPGNVTQAVSVK